MREAAAAYQGQWRDVVLFLCAVLFTVIWWNINHNRTSWAADVQRAHHLSILTAGTRCAACCVPLQRLYVASAAIKSSTNWNRLNRCQEIE